MAKGNMLLGYSRGAVGDVVFARSKGQQIQRARNRNPKNPKTRAQMAQRSIFACAIEFFKRGQQNLFQFAFESKGTKQSDYNAFMSVNAKRGIYVTPEQVKNARYPMVGNYIMSQGSLVRDLMGKTVGVGDAVFLVGDKLTMHSNAEPFTTFGALSTELKKYGFLEGDIVTICQISAEMPGRTTGSAPKEAETAPVWKLQQFIVDSTSTEAVPNDWRIYNNIEEAGEPSVGVAFATDSATDPEQINALVVVVSRKENGTVKVTSSQLVGSKGWNDCIAAATGDSYMESVLTEWQASEEAILKGSLAE